MDCMTLEQIAGCYIMMKAYLKTINQDTYTDPELILMILGAGS